MLEQLDLTLLRTQNWKAIYFTREKMQCLNSKAEVINNTAIESRRDKALELSSHVHNHREISQILQERLHLHYST